MRAVFCIFGVFEKECCVENNIESHQEVTESDIIDRILAGEIDLYELLVRRYNGYLYKIAKSYGYEHDDVEDLMQETYIRAYSHLAEYEHRAPFKSWLAHILLHLCYHNKHKLSATNELPSSEEIENESDSSFKKGVYDGNRVVQNTELKEVIETAIKSLPEDYRIVFMLRELSDHSTSEVADILNISEDNVKTRLKRARKMLQDEIGKLYSTDDLFDFHLDHHERVTERGMHAVRSLNR